MTTYKLSADPAEIRNGGFMVSCSYLNDQLIGVDAVVEIKTPDQLTAAKHAHGLAVLASNSLRPQHPDVTSERRTLDAVAVSHRPVTRHGSGCKALPFTMIVERP